MPASDPARPWLLAAAAHGLGGAVPAVTAPDAALWSAVLAGAVRERLVPLLGRLCDEAPVSLGADQRAQLASEETRTAVRMLHLEAHLVRLAGVLDEARVPFRVLKGAALATLDYERPGDRSWNDLDLLVRSADFDRTVGLLTAQGCRRLFPEPRPGFDRRFGKGAPLLAPEGFEVDLHRTWLAGPYAHLVDIDAVLGRSEPVPLAGRTVPALTREDRLLHVCFHAVVAEVTPRLLPLRDVLELVRRPLDVGVVRDRAREWHAEAVLSTAVMTARATLGVPGTSDLEEDLRRRPPGRKGRWATRGYTGGNYVVEMATAVAAVRGVRPRLAYLRALTFPQRSYLQGRHESRSRRLVYAVRSLWRWGGGVRT